MLPTETKTEKTAYHKCPVGLVLQGTSLTEHRKTTEVRYESPLKAMNFVLPKPPKGGGGASAQNGIWRFWRIGSLDFWTIWAVTEFTKVLA